MYVSICADIHTVCVQNVRAFIRLLMHVGMHVFIDVHLFSSKHK